MADKNARFNVRGYYLMNGVKSSHDGRVMLYPDGRLLGIIDTHNSDGSSNTRLFLGVYEPQDFSIKFMKVPRPNSGFVPVIYSLTSERLHSGETPDGGYRGFWHDLGHIPLFPEIRDAVSGEEIRITPRLERMKIRNLTGYFDDSCVERYEQCGARLGQRGFLGFQRCPEVSRVR